MKPTRNWVNFYKRGIIYLQLLTIYRSITVTYSLLISCRIFPADFNSYCAKLFLSAQEEGKYD